VKSYLTGSVLKAEGGDGMVVWLLAWNARGQSGGDGMVVLLLAWNARGQSGAMWLLAWNARGQSGCSMQSTVPGSTSCGGC
jgi:hypothetical protein